MLRQYVAQGQQILRRLIVGWLDCDAQPKGSYSITGTTTFGRLVEARGCSASNRVRSCQWLEVTEREAKASACLRTAAGKVSP
jgi:hypothetical protein